MSIKSAMECIKKMRADKKFKARFTKAKNIDEKLKIAKAAGFTFTLPELKQARDKMTRASLEELDQAAGGTTCSSCNAGRAASGGGGGGGGYKSPSCNFGSGDWGGNSGEMASEGAEEVVEMAEL